MPAILPDPNRGLTNLLNDLTRRVRALETQHTTWYVDNNLNNVAIAGNIGADNQGNATGLSGWGFAHKNTSGKWVGLENALSPVNGNLDSAPEQYTTSTTPTDLAVPGPSITFTTGQSGVVLLFISCIMGQSVSGVATQVWLNMDGSINPSYNVLFCSPTGSVTNAAIFPMTLTPSTTHTAKLQYSVTSGTGGFANGSITALPL